LKRCIVGVFLQRAQPIEIAGPPVAELLRDQPGKPRIAFQQPATRRDPIGLVLNFLG
jgi:hypothetical protein